MPKIRPKPILALLLIFVVGAGCLPAYQPRDIPVPAGCAQLERRAVEQGLDSLSEREFQELEFCQQQQMLRAQEEQAAYARMQGRGSESYAVLTGLSLLASLLITLAYD